jgi:hypothetical protein
MLVGQAPLNPRATHEVRVGEDEFARMWGNKTFSRIQAADANIKEGDEIIYIEADLETQTPTGHSAPPTGREIIGLVYGIIPQTDAISFSVMVTGKSERRPR